jgi:hypothetical protein
VKCMLAPTVEDRRDNAMPWTTNLYTKGIRDQATTFASTFDSYDYADWLIRNEGLPGSAPARCSAGSARSLRASWCIAPHTPIFNVTRRTWSTCPSLDVNNQQ